MLRRSFINNSNGIIRRGRALPEQREEVEEQQFEEQQAGGIRRGGGAQVAVESKA